MMTNSTYSTVKENILQLATEKPEYVDVIERIFEWEQNNKKPDSSFVKDDKYPAKDTHFTFRDIQTSPQKLHHLHNNMILESVTSAGGGGNEYCLTNKEATDDALSEIEESFEDGVKHVSHNFPSEDDLPDDLFMEVKGEEKAKWLLKRGITTDEITNFLLLGPAGSGKTVFLMCIRDKLNDAKFVSATDATSSGFIDVLFEDQPKYILYDEIDDMDKSEQESLSQYMETGIVQETKHGKTREMKINTKTLATANDINSIKGNIADRFTILRFEEYEKDEFIEVCKHVLPMKQGKTEAEAEIIAKAVWNQRGKGDVRQAIQVARLSRGDPKKVIDALDEYSVRESITF